MIDIELEMMTFIADNAVTRAHLTWLESKRHPQFGREYGARGALVNTREAQSCVHTYVSLGDKAKARHALSDAWNDFKGGIWCRAQWQEESRWMSETIGLYYEMLK